MENKKALFLDFENHLLNDRRPSEFFNKWVKSEVSEKEYPFTMLSDLVNVPQSPKYHPEGSVWNHTMMVLDNAAERKSSSIHQKAFMWAALLHDIGKAPTTRIRKGKITSYEHDNVGEKMAVNFLKVFTEDDDFIKKVSKLVKWHMQVLFVVKGLPFADINNMVAEVSVDEISLLALCDRLGRGNMDNDKMQEEKENINTFKEKVKDL